MKRRTRAVPFARIRIDPVLRNLTAQPVDDWPKHLRLAWEVLAKKRGVDNGTARAVLFASFSAARRCAQAIDQRSRTNVNAVAPSKLRKMFARIARCIRRSPASLRRVLNREVCSSVQSRGLFERSEYEYRFREHGGAYRSIDCSVCFIAQGGNFLDRPPRFVPESVIAQKQAD